MEQERQEKELKKAILKGLPWHKRIKVSGKIAVKTAKAALAKFKGNFNKAKEYAKEEIKETIEDVKNYAGEAKSALTEMKDDIKKGAEKVRDNFENFIQDEVDKEFDKKNEKIDAQIDEADKNLYDLKMNGPASSLDSDVEVIEHKEEYITEFEDHLEKLRNKKIKRNEKGLGVFSLGKVVFKSIKNKLSDLNNKRKIKKQEKKAEKEALKEELIKEQEKLESIQRMNELQSALESNFDEINEIRASLGMEPFINIFENKDVKEETKYTVYDFTNENQKLPEAQDFENLEQEVNNSNDPIWEKEETNQTMVSSDLSSLEKELFSDNSEKKNSKEFIDNLVYQGGYKKEGTNLEETKNIVEDLINKTIEESKNVGGRKVLIEHNGEKLEISRKVAGRLDALKRIKADINQRLKPREEEKEVVKGEVKTAKKLTVEAAILTLSAGIGIGIFVGDAARYNKDQDSISALNVPITSHSEVYEYQEPELPIIENTVANEEVMNNEISLGDTVRPVEGTPIYETANDAIQNINAGSHVLENNFDREVSALTFVNNEGNEVTVWNNDPEADSKVQDLINQGYIEQTILMSNYNGYEGFKDISDVEVQGNQRG